MSQGTYTASAETTLPGAVVNPDGSVTVVVGRSPGVSNSDVANALVDLAPSSVKAVPGLPASTVTVDQADAGRVDGLLGDAARYVEPEREYHATAFAPTDPLYPFQPELGQIGLPGAWSTTTGSAVIAVLDTGIYKGTDAASNPDLADATASNFVAGYDFIGNDADPSIPLPSAADPGNHGTLVASVAGARSNNFGIVGACPNCKIMPVRVLDVFGHGVESNIAAGINWATTHGANVINLSFSGSADSQIVDQAILAARTAGIVVVAAAGNSGDGTDPSHPLPLAQALPPEYPAADPGVLSVGATCSATAASAGYQATEPPPHACPSGTPNGTLAQFSSRGSWVQVAAPGVTLATAGSDPTTASYNFSGTSAATPLVAGVAGLLKSAHPNWTEGQIRGAITQTAAPVGPAGTVAYGEVRADAAIAVADPPTPPTTTTVAPPTTVGPPPVDSPPSGSVDGLPAYVSGRNTVVVRATDDRGVAALLLQVDGTGVQADFGAVGPGVWAASWDTAQVGDGPVNVSLAITDTGGNRMVTASSATVVDNRPPSIVLVGPPQGSVVRAAFGVAAAVSDVGTGVKLTLIAAGNAWVGIGTGSGLIFATVPVAAAGPVDIRALTVDNAGHLAISNAITVVRSPAKTKVLAKKVTRRKR